jgi:hypothetical protein
MWKKVLGWVLFFGGIFVGVATIGSSFQDSLGRLSLNQINFVEVALWVTVTVALIWGGWKLAHRKK